MQHMSDAPAGKQYYAWLQNNSENTPSFNWPITAKNGSLSSDYTAPQHINLLANNPRLFLITVEMAGHDPLVANFVPNARLYYANLLSHPIQNLATFDILPCPQGGSNNICMS